MSDDEGEKPDRFLDAYNHTMENAFHRLYLKGLHKAPCPICQNTEWLDEIRTDPESEQIDYNAPVFLPKDPRSFWGPAPAIPALIFTCSNCGFLRMHNASWLEEQAFKEAPDDE